VSTAIRRSLPFALAGIAVAAVIGMIAYARTVGPSFDYNGDWIGNRNLSGPNPEIAYTLGRVTLSVKDNHFESTSGGFPTDGSVSYEGDHIVLHTERVIGVPVSHASTDAAKNHPDVIVSPRKDGTLLFQDPMALDGKPVALKRTKLAPGG
jgi:hypothetical protein